MPRKQQIVLKAGTLIEPDESDDKAKLPTKRQLYRVEREFDKLPTHEVLRRLYKRHSVGVWQSVSVLMLITVIWSNL